MVSWHVEHGEDSAASHEGALLFISDVNSLEAIDMWHGVLRVEVVPFFVGWEVDFNGGRSTEVSHVWSWLANLWSNEYV